MTARIAVATAAAVALVGCSQAGGDDGYAASGGRAESTLAKETPGAIVAVTDGDTLRVRIKGRTERVRLLGIDTPETRRPGGRVECGGPQAKALCAASRTRARVHVSTDPTQDARDRYDRLLAYVDVNGKGDAGAAMVHKGWAKPYIYRGNPVRRHSLYASLARSASRVGRGVWGRCGGDYRGR